MRIGRRIGGVAAILLAAAVVPAAARAQGAGSHPVQQNTAEQAVMALEKARFAAMHDADVAALDKMLSADLTYTHTSGVVQTKEQFIGDIKTGTIKYLTLESTDMKVRIYGSTAVIAGGASVHIILNGNDASFKIRYTDVYVNRGGSWQLVAWEATRLPQ